MARKKVLRIALDNTDALKDTDPRNFSIFVDPDVDNVLIKELKRGSSTVALNSTDTIAHDLNYLPLYFVYAEVASNRYRIANSFDPVGSGWRAYVDTDNLYIANIYSSTYTGYQYYIFYDDMD